MPIIPAVLWQIKKSSAHLLSCSLPANTDVSQLMVRHPIQIQPFSSNATSEFESGHDLRKLFAKAG